MQQGQPEPSSQSAGQRNLPTAADVRAQRMTLKRQAKSWEVSFEQAHGAKPSGADRRADKQYLAIRRQLKHADEALGMLTGGATSANFEAALGREAHLAGLRGYWVPSVGAPSALSKAISVCGV